ncbi:MAG: DUF3427 domain-containing protein [Myxococcales bacterium]|nr:DUF3427 domain-containing protein [Myxococcales bacterium]
MPKLAPGLYDSLVTHGLAEELRSIAMELQRTEPLTRDRADEVLARALHGRIEQALRAIGGDEPIVRQVELANRVLKALSEDPESGALASDQVPEAPRRLRAILEDATPPASPVELASPKIPLGTSDLLVNAHYECKLGPALISELASVDRVDLLCSFVKWSGLRVLDEALAAFLRRRPGTLRVLTTTYMGATDQRALDRLVELGAEVKVSYESSRTRLHAKAWLLHRLSGFSTAYIGSSNLSAAAILDGLEWNVRLSRVDNRPILERFEAAFSSYWSDDEFRDYDPDEFSAAIDADRRARAHHVLRFELTPKPHQREILDALAAERERGHRRNLVVAATGTGKTVVAALDYKRLRGGLPRSRLLFVAHRREILRQSQATFQVALGDAAFGELLGDGQEPRSWEHVFANIQSLPMERLATIAPDHFDVVIVDEFHHAAAKSYDDLLAHLRPKILVGLTATPERADGRSVLGWFDGRIASETRLWAALEQQLLCPFHYFAIGGGPNLDGVKWSRGRYDTRALSNVYTADHLFALRILQETRAKVRDITRMRALGFCVDIAHARFMAAYFVEHGVAAEVLTGASSGAERDAVQRRLRGGEVQIVFTVDLFNEGVDLPEVDTLLFLRPTESATVFLQQLGRGLRRVQGKECCAVLDFVSPVDRRFRFDLRYRAIVGGTRRQLESQLIEGFPSLPSGCSIQLDRAATDAVLTNIRAALRGRERGLVEDLKGLAARGAPPSLAEFLGASQLELADLYTNEWCWARLRRAAGLASEGPELGDEHDRVFVRALARMLHLDDERLAAFSEFVGRARPPRADDREPYQRLLFVALGQMSVPYDAMNEVWGRVWGRPWLRAELGELLALLDDRRRSLPQPLGGRLADLPLRVHGHYSRDEVFAALDERTRNNKVKRTQGGIYDCKERRTELLFVELDKRERDYTPTTLYNDYPVTPTLFHWESQASAHPGTPSGRRYLGASPGGEQEILLFVRQRRKDERGETRPYLLLGQCELLRWEGERPMKIEWRLRTPMPAWFFEASRVAG